MLAQLAKVPAAARCVVSLKLADIGLGCPLNPIHKSLACKGFNRKYGCCVKPVLHLESLLNWTDLADPEVSGER
jgi:hypothetical protein